MGMQPKKNKFKPTTSEIELLEKLRRNPRMRERIEPILKLAEGSDNALDAHQVEEILVDEIGKLGNQTLCTWASGVEERLGDSIRDQEQAVVQRQKKTSGGTPSTDRSK